VPFSEAVPSLAITVIIKNEDINFDPIVELLDIQQAITDVACGTVKPDKSGTGLLMRDEPSM